MGNNWEIASDTKADLDGDMFWGTVNCTDKIFSDNEYVYTVIIGIKVFEMSKSNRAFVRGVLHTGNVHGATIHDAILSANNLYVAATQLYVSKINDALRGLRVPERKGFEHKHIRINSNNAALRMLRNAR